MEYLLIEFDFDHKCEGYINIFIDFQVLIDHFRLIMLALL